MNICLTAYFSIVSSKSWVNKGHFRSRISNPILWTNIYDQSLLFIPTKRTQYDKYMYSSPFTSHMFRCLLHHLQGDHCVICKTKTIWFLQCYYEVYNISCFLIYNAVTKFKTTCISSFCFLKIFNILVKNLGCSTLISVTAL